LAYMAQRVTKLVLKQYLLTQILPTNYKLDEHLSMMSTRFTRRTATQVLNQGLDTNPVTNNDVDAENCISLFCFTYNSSFRITRVTVSDSAADSRDTLQSCDGYTSSSDFVTPYCMDDAYDVYTLHSFTIPVGAFNTTHLYQDTFLILKRGTILSGSELTELLITPSFMVLNYALLEAEIYNSGDDIMIKAYHKQLINKICVHRMLSLSISHANIALSKYHFTNQSLMPTEDLLASSLPTEPPSQQTRRLADAEGTDTAEYHTKLLNQLVKTHRGKRKRKPIFTQSKVRKLGDMLSSIIDLL